MQDVAVNTNRRGRTNMKMKLWIWGYCGRRLARKGGPVRKKKDMITERYRHNGRWQRERNAWEPLKHPPVRTRTNLPWRANITNPRYFQQPIEIIIPSIQNAVGICEQISILIHYQVSSTLVTLLKFIYAAIQVANVLVLTAFCKLITFVFQIFSLFVPEMSTGFMSYIV
jgi:hypothetical protein